jgi:hypothetical protein
MSVRKSLVVLALAATALPGAFAQVKSVWVGGKKGRIDLPVQSTLTREQVDKDFQALRANPVAPDGGRYVGGQLGYVFPQHVLAFENGKFECIGQIPHNPRPDAVISSSERRRFLELNPA